jgi:hypothetical protein
MLSQLVESWRACSSCHDKLLLFFDWNIFELLDKFRQLNAALVDCRL